MPFFSKVLLRLRGNGATTRFEASGSDSSIRMVGRMRISVKRNGEPANVSPK